MSGTDTDYEALGRYQAALEEANEAAFSRDAAIAQLRAELEKGLQGAFDSTGSVPTAGGLATAFVSRHDWQAMAAALEAVRVQDERLRAAIAEANAQAGRCGRPKLVLDEGPAIPDGSGAEPSIAPMPLVMHTPQTRTTTEAERTPPGPDRVYSGG